MTTQSRGARTTALKSSEATTSTPNPSPISPPVDDDGRIQYLARRVADGHSLPESARAFLFGRGSSDDAPVGLASDLGLGGVADYRALAKAALERDAFRREVIERAMAVATGRQRLDEASRPTFLSSLRRLRGSVPAELSKALNLAPEADWSFVAEKLGGAR